MVAVIITLLSNDKNNSWPLLATHRAVSIDHKISHLILKTTLRHNSLTGPIKQMRKLSHRNITQLMLKQHTDNWYDT